MRYCVGVDISSRRVDLAAVPLLDEPRLGVNVHLTSHHISHTDKQAKEWARDPAMRTVALGKAARTCLHVLHARGLDIAAVCIEWPAGHSQNTLLPILGVVTGALDEYPLCWLRAATIRSELGCGPSKEAAHAKVADLTGGPDEQGRHINAAILDEHMTDALACALAYRQLLQRAEAAA